MRKYDAYKESAIEYINEIPVSWEVKPLYTLFNEVKDKNKGNIESNVLSLSYGNIKKRNIESNMGLLPDSFETYNRIEKDDIVLRLTDLQNDKKSLRTGLVREQGIITSAYVTLRKRSKNIKAEYVHWLLHSFDVKKVFYNLGAGVRQSMGYSELKKMNLLLPSINEQKKIIEYLQSKVFEIDKLVENLNVFINKLEQQRQSIITEAVTKGLNPNVKMKDSGVEWIGEIPEHWKVSKLKYHSIRVGDGLHGTPKYDDQGEYYFINGNNLGEISIKLNEKTNKVNEDEFISHAQKIRGNSILISLNGTIGNVSIYNNEKIMLSKSAGYISLDNDVDVLFVYHWLKNMYVENYFTQSFAGTTIKNLSLETLRNTPILLMTLNEQQEIAHYLKGKIKGTNFIVDEVKKQISKLKEYRQALIYEAVTGKIDVRDMEID